MAQAIELNSVRKGTTRATSCSSPRAARARCSPARSRASSGYPRVLVPPHPGIIAATGLLATDIQHEYVATERHLLRRRSTAEHLRRGLRELIDQALAAARAPTACREERRLLRRLADCRYVGQGYEVRFDVPAGAIDATGCGELAGGLPSRARTRVRSSVRARRSRSSTSASSGSAGSTTLTWPELAHGDERAVAPLLERDVVFDAGGHARGPPYPLLRARRASRPATASRVRR